jgi:hypothetical protein
MSQKIRILQKITVKGIAYAYGELEKPLSNKVLQWVLDKKINFVIEEC